MKPSDRLELDDLRATQRVLRKELSDLEQRIERLISRVEAEPEIPAEPAMKAVAPPAPVTPKPVEPALPPPLPISPPTITPSPATATMAAAPAPTPSQPPPPLPAAASKGESFEAKLGTFWLVRIGVVLLLTGLVFLGNYAYHRVIAHVGPLAKVSLLSLAGGALAGIGLWLERGAEKMRNYARVLIAGGAAAIYYTTYAAHFVENLRVIASPIVGGAALLALAGGIAWFADRRKSETIALLAVLLSYYTAAINPVASFSLFSNLLLTALAVFFLARHRWASLSFAALTATYASFGYWRFVNSGHWLFPAKLTTAEFWSQGSFLAGYWLLFTIAVFVSRAESLRPAQRTPFLTANNGAFFALFAPTVGVAYPGSFSLFALAFGGILIALSVIARRLREEDWFMDGAYLSQGLAVVTIAIAAKFTGYQLALALAIESAVLLEMSRFRHGVIFKIGSVGCALAASVYAVQAFIDDRGQLIPLGTALVVIFVFNAWRYKQSRALLAEGRLKALPSGFVLLAFLLGLFVLREWSGAENFLPALAIASGVCAASLPLLRLPELAVISQGYLAIAHFAWLSAGSRPEGSDARTGILLVVTVALMHWWPRQRTLKIAESVQPVVDLPFAAAAVAMMHVWLWPKFPGSQWMLVSGGIAVATLAYAIFTRAWWFAALSQTFNAACVYHFFAHFFSRGAWPGAIEWRPIAAIALLAAQTVVFTIYSLRLPPILQGPIRILASIYRVILTVMLFVWSLACLPVPIQVVAITGLAFGYFLISASRQWRTGMLHAAALAAGALVLLWTRKLFSGEVHAGDVVAMLLLLLAQQFARRRKLNAALVPPPAHSLLIVAALSTVWMQATHTAMRSEHGLLLTLSWSGLAFAVLAGGFILRERLYRQLALGLFGLAIGRVFLVDVWRFETIYRILSFVVLGILLIVVSFVYNRYGERLRGLW